MDLTELEKQAEQDPYVKNLIASAIAAQCYYTEEELEAHAERRRREAVQQVRRSSS